MFADSPSLPLVTAMLEARRAEADRERLLGLVPRRPLALHPLVTFVGRRLRPGAPETATALRCDTSANACCASAA